MKTKTAFASALFLGFILIACADKKVGDQCETYRSSECGGPGGTCLGNNSGNYCTITCSAGTDCPAGFKCGDVKSTTINGKGETKGETVVKMCLKRT